MSRKNEKGVAMILTLITLSVLSVMAVSFMFLSQSETLATLNYRLTSLARDAAEAGLNSSANYFVNGGYTAPVTGGADPIASYTLTTFPVQSGGNPVILSGSTTAHPANYPVAAVQTAYDTNGVGKGTITTTIAGTTTTASYATYATLLSMRQITITGGTVGTIQTWRVVSEGTVNNGVRTALVEVSVLVEKPIVPTYSYAAFATSDHCGALTFSQAGTSTNSYDSTVSPVPGGVLASGGNVGTNGNLTVTGNATINGSLSTPATGTGTCVGGGAANTAVTACGGCTIGGGAVALPQTISYPTPALPSPMPPLTAQSAGTDCGTVPNCTNRPGVPSYHGIDLAPGNYGRVDIGSAMDDIHLTAGTYNLDSFTMGNVDVIIDSGPVIFNITGCATLNAGSTACATYLPTAVNIASTGNLNPSYNPMSFQIQYAGPGIVNLQCGGTVASALVYAPLAAVTMSANAGFYGSVIGLTVDVSSGTDLYYDRNLQDGNYTLGNSVLGGFSWAKF